MGSFIIAAVTLILFFGWIIVTAKLDSNFIFNLKDKILLKIIGVVLVIGFSISLFFADKRIFKIDVIVIVTGFALALSIFTIFVLVKYLGYFYENYIEFTDLGFVLVFLLAVSFYVFTQNIVFDNKSIDSMFEFISNENPVFKVVSFLILIILASISFSVLFSAYLHILNTGLRKRKILSRNFYLISGLFGFTLGLIMLVSVDSDNFTDDMRVVFQETKQLMQVIYSSLVIPTVFTYLNKGRKNGNV